MKAPQRLCYIAANEFRSFVWFVTGHRGAIISTGWLPLEIGG